MSALCGIFHLDGRPVARGTVAGMSAALAHRGPDRSGEWSEESVALAHRLLCTTPESLAEAQPVVLAHEGIVAVADARIDNRDELRASLGSRAPARSSDCDLIAAAYLRWGPECVQRLVGDFAFAVWNSRERSLFCARDPMGVRPFYYVATERLFAFGSELKAILTIPGVSATIDEEQVALFLGWSQDERSRTIFRELMRLPAGHTLLVTADKIKVQRYWNPESSPDVRFASDAEYVEAFRDRFSSAVAACLRGVEPVGATLSGGLDSSSIVCMSRKLRGLDAAPLQTFSVIFPSLPERELRLIDERQFVETVIAGGRIEPHFVRGDETSPLRDIERMLWHLDEPHSSPNLFLHCAMFEAAHESGARVLLDGFDGDSAISHGFGRLTGLMRADDLDALEVQLRDFSAHHQKGTGLALREYVLPHLSELARRGDYLAWFRTASRLAQRFQLSRRELAKDFGLRPLIPTALRARSRSVRPGDLTARELLQPGLARALKRHGRRSATAELRRPPASEREAHLHALMHPGYQVALEVADKSAAAFGVEPRYPFFDRRLIEFCVGLPEEQKFDKGWPRLLFRRAMEGILPPEIQWRSWKANLSPNFQRRFRDVDFASRVAIGSPALARYVRTDRLRDLAERFRAPHEIGSMRAEAFTLFRTAILDEWLAQSEKKNGASLTSAGVPSPAAA
ncbi:MAG TPA: lasso peptide isopeptide bond-forming cyclase [Gemmatimonadaceae bacterium]|nr:lasso peptide isopeptide bond-forming cyclase [Gemmatimonadaceae bacterium]